MVRNVVVIGVLFVLAFVQPAHATPISFTFGFSSEITVPANERVTLPGILINTGTDPIVFDDIDFGWGMAAGPNEDLAPLNIKFGSFQQFQHVTLPVGQTFSFVFASIQFDPSFWMVLHPTFLFRMEGERASIVSTISVGPELKFGPPAFAPSEPIKPVPEPPPLLMLVSVAAVAGVARIRRTLT